MVIVNGPQMLDEVRKRPDEELSFIESTEDVSRTIPTRLITDFDLAAVARVGRVPWLGSSCKSGTSSGASPTTTRITSTSSGTSSRGRFPRSSRTWSTRSGLRSPSIFRPTGTVRALRVSYFGQGSSLTEGSNVQHAGTIEWTTVDVIKTMQKIVARLSNRVFVGLPTCQSFIPTYH